VLSVAERIVTILGGLRRRLVLTRAAEAAAVAGAVGGVTAAALMAAWILAGRYPLAASALSGALAVAGVFLAARPAWRERLHPARPVQWLLTLLLAVCGLAGAVLVLGGAFVAVQKNWLLLVLPASAAGGAAACLVSPAPLSSVAVWADHQARLRERLSTAWELIQRRQQSGFAQAVRRQALAAAEDIRPGGIRFWTRTRATLGALLLAVAAAGMMLPWEVLESPALRQQRLWRQVGPQAGQSLEEQLAVLEKDLLAGSPQVAGQVARLAELARQLRAARPEDARQWRARAAELDQVVQAIRRAVESGQLTGAARQQAEQLIRALEDVSAQLAEGMAAGTTELAGGQVRQPPGSERPFAPSTRQAPRGWTTVYNPRYALLATAPGAETATSPAGIEVESPPVAGEPYEQAWQQARRRAAQAAARADVPPQYRQLIRDFFADR
jgi:hypothetical protein